MKCKRPKHSLTPFRVVWLTACRFTQRPCGQYSSAGGICQISRRPKHDTKTAGRCTPRVLASLRGHRPLRAVYRWPFRRGGCPHPSETFNAYAIGKTCVGAGFYAVERSGTSALGAVPRPKMTIPPSRTKAVTQPFAQGRLDAAALPRHTGRCGHRPLRRGATAACGAMHPKGTCFAAWASPPTEGSKGCGAKQEFGYRFLAGDVVQWRQGIPGKEFPLCWIFLTYSGR